MLTQHGCYNKKRFSSFEGYKNKQKYRSTSILNSQFTVPQSPNSPQ